MKILSALSGVALAVTMATAPTLASANIQYFNISGNDGLGAFSAHVAVDFVGGMAASGSGFINGAGFGAPESLTLITLATPDGICGTAHQASAFFRHFIQRERCGHMSGLSARPWTAGLDEIRDARG